MAESAQAKQDVMYKKKYLETIAELIFNKKEFSDVTFLVNKKKYYASRIQVSAASEVLASTLKEHFANTTDKEVLLADIKHNDSFFNILQYIHGIEINLTRMNKLVLCETIRLSEQYKLTEFHQDLKCYLSELKRFKMNSIVVMLNTAKTYDLTQLYEKLKVYVYQHVEQVIKHKTFVNLQHDVLVDLLKSDWLHTKEIDILRAALTWHNENIVDVELDNVEPLVEDGETQSEAEIDVEDIESEDEIDMVEEFLSKYSDELFACDKPEIESTEVQVETGIKIDTEKSDNQEIIPNEENSNLTENPETPTVNSSPVEEDSHDGKSNAVEIFSENVLKSLLKHIRFSIIPAFDLLNALDSELFQKYKDNIVNLRHDSHIQCEMRKLYFPSPLPKIVSSGRKIFTLNNVKKESLDLGKHYFCNETYSCGNFDIRLYVKCEEIDNIKYLSVYLYCINMKIKKIEISYAIELLSYDPSIEQSVKCRTEHKFTDDKEVGCGWPNFIDFSKLFNPIYKYIENDTLQFELHFKVKE